MKILDRYIVKQFLLTFLFGILAFTLIFVVIDMMEKMDDFIDHNVAALKVFEYYIVFIPEIIKLITPVAVLLAGLFTSGKMASLNEITAIKAGGVNYYRFIAPFLATAIFISLLSVYFGGYVVPSANKQRVYIEQHHLKKGIVHNNDNIYFQDSDTRIVTISYFDTKLNKANRVGIQIFDSEKLTHMLKRIDASNMTYDSTSSGWILTNVLVREFPDTGEIMEERDSLLLTNLNFSPIDVMKKQMKPVEMTLDELDEYAKEQIKSGNDPTRILIEYHSRYSFAFASFIVVLFGLTIATNNRKSGAALQFGINIVITFIYLVVFKIGEAFGKNGVLDPLLTAWSANIVFFAAAVINMLRVEK